MTEITRAGPAPDRPWQDEHMSIPAFELMTALRSGPSTSPRLTWYGPDGERVELSGRGLDNWVAKTANLLVDGLGLGPGDTATVAVPPHWQTAAPVRALPVRRRQIPCRLRPHELPRHRR